MRAVPRNEWPGWMKKRLSGRKCIEVKEQNERYYLYTYTNIWDKDKQRPHKVTKYEGILSEKTESHN